MQLVNFVIFVRLQRVALAFAGRVCHVVLGLISFKLVELNPQGGGGGQGTLIFSHIRRLGLFFGVQNSEFQYFWGF